MFVRGIQSDNQRKPPKDSSEIGYLINQDTV